MDKTHNQKNLKTQINLDDINISPTLLKFIVTKDFSTWIWGWVPVCGASVMK